MTFRPYKPREAGSPHEATARFLDECGGARAVSNFIGRSPSAVNGWADPDAPGGAAGIGFAHLCILTEHFGSTVMAEHLALRAGGLFLNLGPVGDVGGRASVLDTRISLLAYQSFGAISFLIDRLVMAHGVLSDIPADDLAEVEQHLEGVASRLLDLRRELNRQKEVSL